MDPWSTDFNTRVTNRQVLVTGYRDGEDRETERDRLIGIRMSTVLLVLTLRIARCQC